MEDKTLKEDEEVMEVIVEYIDDHDEMSSVSDEDDDDDDEVTVEIEEMMICLIF